jgi:hypothetical protein
MVTICSPVDCGTACKLPLKPPGSGKFIYISWVPSVVLLIVVQPVNCQLSLPVPEPGGFTGSLQAVPQSTGQQMVPNIYK